MSLFSLPCCICSQIAGDSTNDLLAKHLDPPGQYTRRIPMESEHFAVIPSVGPLCPGHILICPKKHYRSLAALERDELTEFAIFKEEVSRKLRDKFRAPVHAFEHGAARYSDRLICTVDHAHLHLIPTFAELSETIVSALQWTKLPTGTSDLRSSTGGREYISYETPSGDLFITQQDRPFESQLMRKLFAQALERPSSWNWRETPCIPDLRATYSALVTSTIDS
jgi:ATP adenylyltransferase